MKLLTVARDLGRRKARERQQLFVAEGVRTVDELLRSTLSIRGVLIGSQFDENPRAAALNAMIAERSIAVERVDFREFASAAQTDSPQGILAIAEVPSWSLSQVELQSKVRLLVLDGVKTQETSARSSERPKPLARQRHTHFLARLTSGTPRSSVAVWVPTLDTPVSLVPGMSSTRSGRATRSPFGAPMLRAQR